MRIAQRDSSCRAFVLYAVLIVVVLSSMVAVSLLYATKSAETATAAGEQGEQAWAVAMSGVYKAIQVVLSAAPGDTSWRDNPDQFKDQLVLDDGQDKWYFTIYEWSGGEESEENLVYGLSDEASKLNLKYLANEVKTNAMETELFAALKETPTETEDDYYFGEDLEETSTSSSLADQGERGPGEEGGSSEAPRASQQSVSLPSLSGSDNPPEYEFLDAFAAKAGYNLRTLYGKDLDMNLKADDGTEDVGEAFQSGTASGVLGMGLRHYLTTTSYDLNCNSLGESRVNLNSTNAGLSSLGLSEETLSFVEAMQRSGKTIANPAVLLSATEKLKDEEGNEKEYSVELSADERETLLDSCTTVDEKYLPGLINVNTASEEVLMALPGIEESEAEAIVSAREGLMSDQMKTPVWLLDQGILDTEKFQAIYPYITARAWQYHFYVVGYSIPSGRYRVLEVVIDTAGQTPQSLMMRDLSRLGMPFKIETEGSETSATAI